MELNVDLRLFLVTFQTDRSVIHTLGPFEMEFQLNL